MSILIYIERKKKIFLAQIINRGLHIKGSWDAHNRTAAKSNGPWPHGFYKYDQYTDHIKDDEKEMFENNKQAEEHNKMAEKDNKKKKTHWDSILETMYGGQGIHKFFTPKIGEALHRLYMGVHAGRSKDTEKTGWSTLGCIRVTSVGMTEINKLHETDPLTHILVSKEISTSSFDIDGQERPWPQHASGIA